LNDDGFGAPPDSRHALSGELPTDRALRDISQHIGVRALDAGDDTTDEAGGEIARQRFGLR
jgi:hypothetical protein